MGKGGTERKGRGWMRCRLGGRNKGGSGAAGCVCWSPGNKTVMALGGRGSPTPWENSSSLLILTVPNSLLGYRLLPVMPWDWYRVKLASLVPLGLSKGLLSLCSKEGHVVQGQSTK